MKRSKRCLALLLALLLFVLSGCGGANDESGEEQSKTSGTDCTETSEIEEKSEEISEISNETSEETSEEIPVERSTYKHVIIIGVDGAGNFHRNCNTPNMDGIFAEGAYTDYCRASSPSISAQCWGAMLIGVKPYVHKLTNDSISAKPYTSDEYPTIFRYVREAHHDAELGAFCNWYPIYEGIIEKNIGVTTAKGDDDVLTPKICDYIKDKKPELLFIQFDSVDHAGHAYGYGKDAYLKAIEKVDSYVGDIYGAICDAGILDDTLLILTADHGGINTSHGGASEEEMNTYFAAIGKTVNKNPSLDVKGRDIAAIVAYALGVEGNEKWDSFVPQEMFTDNMTPEKRPDDVIADRTSEPTPEKGSEKAIENFIDTSKLRVGLFFDGGINDIVGTEEVKTVGTVYYPDGWYGSSLRVSSEGYLSLPGLRFGNDSFTVCMWLKVDDGVGGDPAVFSNKNWVSGMNNGFVYCYNGASKFNVGNTSIRDDFNYGEPEDFTKWNHVILSVDRKSGEVKVYTNFRETARDVLKSGFDNSSFDSGLPFNVGQDGTGRYNCAFSGQVDDLLVFDGAFTADDAEKLGKYYLK